MNPTDSANAIAEAPKMRFHTRKLIKPEDLNANGTLFGGRLLAWIDEEAAIYAICQLGSTRLVTKYMSEINFISSARTGDVIEIGIIASAFGRTSLTLQCEVRNKITRKSILTVDRMVFVSLDEAGHPCPHGKSKITYGSDIEREKLQEEREKTTTQQELSTLPGKPLPREYSLEDPLERRIEHVAQLSLHRSAAGDPPENLVQGWPSVTRTGETSNSPSCALGDAHLG